MVVQHNMQAINANRQLNVVTGQQAKSTEKLSSGFKINRAADDAAGLSISEKMRRQIRGLERASTNAQDGVSAVQTAEGALNEVHDMLQRMNELANQASNGTNSQTDRESIQNEIDALTTEIDRVSETTKFNETYLLKGGDQEKTIRMKAHDAGLDGKLVDNADGTASFQANLKVGEKYKIGNKEYKIKADDGKVATNMKDIAKGVDDLKVGDNIIKTNGSERTAYQVQDNLAAVSLANANNTFSDGGAIMADGNRATITYTDSEGIEKTYEMEVKGGEWQKVTGYNSKTGESNLGGTNLYANSTDGQPTDDELKDVMRTASKIVVTQRNNRTNETVTFGSKEAIKDALEEDARVGDKVFMTETPGAGWDTTDATDASLKGVYDSLKTATDGGEAWKPSEVGMGEPKAVKETDEALVDEDGAITMHDAKKLMAQELAQANGIDVENIKDVSATARRSGSDIANELGFASGDNVTIKKADGNGEYKETNYQIKGELTSDVVGTTFGNVTNGASLEANKSRITVYGADGSTTELKAADNPDGSGSIVWQRVDDDSTLTDSDIKELMKNAVGIDFNADVTKPEVTEKDIETANNPKGHLVNEDKNDVIRWRTAEGMRNDISKLDTSDKVQVTRDGDGGKKALDTGDIEVKNDSGAQVNFDMKIGTQTVKSTLHFNLHVGADADLSNKIGVDIDGMNSKYLGVHGLDVVGKDKDGNNIDDGGKAATYAIDAIEDAISKVNDQRSALGAVQNRLEHTINNLDNVVENTTAAESRIRDTDIADEMVNYSKNNILAQAGQSMLAQANQSTQGALSLLG